LVLAVGCGWAEDLSVVLDSPIVIAAPGQTVDISGIIINNVASTVDLNSISVTLAGMFSEDESAFILGPATVDPNGETVDFELLSVTVDDPYTDPLAAQTGTITILGGVEGAGGYDPTTVNVLGSVDFKVEVSPEPSTASLLVLGAFLALTAVGCTAARIRAISGNG
jgi:hypothetical protein